MADSPLKGKEGIPKGKLPRLFEELWNPDGTIRDRVYGRGRGRPELITPKLIDKIARLIIKGNHKDVAAMSAGIARSTLYNWIDKGKLGRKTEDPQKREELAVYIYFLDTLEEAEATSEVLAVDALYRHFGRNAQAIIQFLEKRHRKNWGPNGPELGEEEGGEGTDGKKGGGVGGFQFYIPTKDDEPADVVCATCNDVFDADRKCKCTRGSPLKRLMAGEDLPIEVLKKLADVVGVVIDEKDPTTAADMIRKAVEG